MKIDSSQLLELAWRYTKAWNSQNPASVAACYSATGSLKVNDAAPAVGREAITDVAMGFMTDFPDMQVTVDDLLIRDDRAIYRWTLSGTHSGTGNRVRISGYEEWEISSDGLIGASLGHFDEADYERQLKGMAGSA
jgi:nuclear transport factor 2 (NTF2) superfamily protein